MLCIKIITAYPEMFPGALSFSLIGKALKEKKFSLETINLHAKVLMTNHLEEGQE